MLALLGFSAGSAAASETLGAGSEPLGARELSFVAGTGPSVASNLAAAMPLADGAAASESTPGPCPRRLVPLILLDSEPGPSTPGPCPRRPVSLTLLNSELGPSRN